MTTNEPVDTGRLQELMQQARSLDLNAREVWLEQLQEPPEVIAALRRELTRIESATRADTTTIEQPTLDAPRQPDPPPGGTLSDPNKLGPYQVIRRLGEGGFGVVFLAHQEEPIRRDVAVKVVRSGVGGSKVLVRFEAERQALALMNHPGLAKVIDAGRTKAGESYFVMEYVDGKPIDEVCDDKKLTLNERIELMISICEAIQHAHGKGIIHRDLKPGNILVSLDGDQLLPRVIDFGIAKALDPDLIGTGGVTIDGQFIGTPNYMSPEQTGFTGEDVDVRADVYSLGAVLYELIVGNPPVGTDTIQKAREDGGLAGMQRVLCEREVPSATAAFQRLCREAPLMAEDVAGRRCVDVRGLQRSLRGDVDWILMCALDRDRDRRYATPLEFAADLRRHLLHEPVAAGPPSSMYRFSKFVRRNRAAVIAVMAVFVVLVVAAIYSNSKRLLAEQSARETESTLIFVENSFNEVDPSLGGGRDLRATEFFIAGYNSIGTAKELEPRVQARLYSLFATVFIALGDYAEAEASAQAGLEVFERSGLSGDETVNTNGLRSLLGEALLNQGKQSDAVSVQAEMDLNTPELHEARGFARHNAGDYDAARWHYRQSIAMRSEFGPTFELAQNIDFLGRLLVDAGEIDEGAVLIEEAAMMRQSLSETEGSAVAMSLLSRGYAAAASGRHQDALQHLEKAHALYWELHKPDVTTMVELCRLEVAGVIDDSATLGDPVASDVPHPTGSLDTGFIEAILLRNRARNLHREGASEAALGLLEESLAITVADPGYHVHTLMAKARVLAELGEIDLALDTVDIALAQLDSDRNPDAAGVAGVRALRTELLLNAGDRAEAARELEILGILRQGYPEHTPPRQTLRLLEKRLESLSTAGNAR
jgi:serine/threonine protein kinase/tetratricopeptide (TPR) repeat protein